MNSVLNKLSEYMYVYISKNIISYTFLPIFKILESLQCILNPGNSCINQLLSITHRIYASLNRDMNFKVCFLTYQRRLIRFRMKVSSLS